MKRLAAVSLFLCVCVSSVFALPAGMLTVGVGGKYSGMAGAGASIVDDITSAYYNPAGICKSGNLELKIGAGAATDGLNDMIATLGNASNPAKFLGDNFGKTINLSGGFNAIIGVNVAKVGISVIPVGNLVLSKPTPGTLIGSNINVTGAYDPALTLGYSFGIPGLPIASLDLGANIKAPGVVIGFSNINSATTTSDTILTYSGMGFDVGAKASINTPVMPVNVGIVMKDISETLKGKVKTQNSTINPVDGSVTTAPVGEADGPDITIPSTTVIGVSTVIPVIGLKVAVDLDNVASWTIPGLFTQPAYSLTHIGVEYPIMGIIALRAGQVSGGPAGAQVQQTTMGVGLNLGVNLNAAMLTDSKNSKNNSTYVDLGFAF